MSEPIAISLRNVSKCFKTYEKPSDRLLELLLPTRGRAHEFWALDDINLDIRKGSTMGIIGRNGSGKSTLLQLIAGTLTPTSGEVKVQGRISALLELGSGFNPEFTGRQNVFFNGKLLGLSKREIEERFDEIAAFADIGHFMDEPTKTYSSGMSVRLAFAVATVQAPDILIVDEALSVGDEAFQRKCFSRIREIQDGGSTILFVSHSAGSIVELCNTAVLMDQGELLLQGYPKLVITEYQKLLYAPSAEVDQLRINLRRMNQRVNEIVKVGAHTSASTIALKEQSSETLRSESVMDTITQSEAGLESEDFDPNLLPQSTVSYVSRGATIVTPHILTLAEKPANILVMGQEYLYRYRVLFTCDAKEVRCGVLLKTVSGLELGGAVSHTHLNPIPMVKSGSHLEIEFKFRCLLCPGVYFVNAGVLAKVEGQEVFLARIIDAAMFRVQAIKGNTVTGAVDFCMTSRVSKPSKQTSHFSLGPRPSP